MKLTKIEDKLRRRPRRFPALFSIVLLSFTSGIQLGKAQSQATLPSGGVRVPAELMAAHCITMVSPDYPQITPLPNPTTVVVQVTVTRSGAVRPIRVLSGPKPFESAALDAVRLWHYRPYIQNDTAIDAITEVSVRFTPSVAGGMITHPNKID